MTAMTSPRFAGFLFDMDGVLYRGNRPLPGARAMLKALATRGIPFALVTNNTTRTPRQCVRHLASLGMRVPPNRIITSSMVTAEHLRKTLRPGARVLVIGEPALRRTLAHAGFVVAWENVAAVVVGLDRRLTYGKLTRATEALVRGAAFIAANPDPLLPTARGIVPGAGATVAALAYAAGRRPRVMGKPSSRLLRRAMASLGLRAAETVMVGDQLATDIAAGRAAGTFTVLVGGDMGSVRPVPRSAPTPDLKVRDLRELWRWAAGRS